MFSLNVTLVFVCVSQDIRISPNRVQFIKRTPFDAENVNDGGSDGGAVFVQCVPARFLTIGVEKRAKNYLEDYANATAGVMCKRPYAVYRISGI